MYLYLHHNFSGVTMSYFEDVLPLFYIEQFSGKTRFFSERAGFFLENLSKSVANSDCSSSSTTDSCSDDSLALLLKFVAIASILVAGIAGVSIPLVGKDRRFLRTDSNLFVAAKAFAAGVILATGFVHMLPDATEKLTDACLPTSPWLEFPFSGFFAMFAALATLVLDVVGTQYYERKQESARQARQNARVGSVDESGIVEVCVTKSDAVVEEEEDGGIHAHGAHHRHNHDQGQEASEGKVSKHSNSHGHDHSHGFGGDDEGVRHIVVSQILELGIVSHSVIIGLSLGVSQSPCTIRPLIAALSFHQFFEGFALGGCISQAKFETLSATVMAFFFAITAPAGIGLGIAISSFYNADSARALVIEGTLDSISAGILVYMALVDLIAHDFLSNKRMKSDARLQLVSYLALFLGASLMSLLAIWA